MERLQNETLDNAIKVYRTCIENAVEYDDDCEYNPILDRATVNLLEELKEYRDLEEQVRLIKLPCKVGDVVWCLEEDGCVGYAFIATSGEYCILAPHYSDCDVIDEQLKEMEVDTENGFEPNVGVFHKNKVFLTKEEAEKALEGMGRE